MEIESKKRVRRIMAWIADLLEADFMGIGRIDYLEKTPGRDERI